MREWLMGQPKDPQLTQVKTIELVGDDLELVAAVGEASYQDALRHLCGSTRWEDIRCEVRAVLVPQPDNPHDANAVMVQVDGQLVGYLSRGDAVDYGPAVKTAEADGLMIACKATIAGRGVGSETSNLGIFLELPDPDETLEAIATFDG